jgi:glucose/arabinose dehydrogenase
MKHRLLSVCFAALLLGACMEPSSPTRPEAGGTQLSSAAITVPSAFTDVQVAGGLTHPTAMALASDGRIFVSEQPGRVRVIKNGTLLATPFVTLNVSSSGERGALGVALDPAFASNHFVYVYYTSSSGPHNRISRFTANGDVSSAEKILMDLPTLSSATNHNGGALHFGSDGKLYISVGENANGSNAQSMNTPLGKMLRINPDGTIPSDNPFFGSTTGNNRAIWALGLRNPFTFAFQPGTGRLFINDVGQSTWEEIDDGLKGANYGWPATEGNTGNSAYKSPFYAYDHSGGCAITGGSFYNPATAAFPAQYKGDYFFADYCGNWIKSIDLSTKAVSNFASGLGSPTDIQISGDGALYYVAYASGSIRKISYSGSQAPSISQQPANKTAVVGASATFTVAATGSAPLAYRWQRNMADIAGAASASYTLNNAQLSDNGARFRCIVSNSAGSATSTEAILTVTSDQPPTADITAPAAGSSFQGGQVINFAGTGTDPEDGALPASAFTWEARLWHDDGNLHSHPFYGPVSGAKSGSFTIPDQGETSPNVWYRIVLTVKDAQGLMHSDSVDILPVKATVTLASSPSGLQLQLDGSSVTAPYTFTGVSGMKRVIAAVTPQASAGKNWRFLSWSDGGAASHTITFPASTATYSAAFEEAPATQVYEAEAATLVGAVKATDHAGYTGTGFADYVNLSNDYVEWTVTAASAGARSLDFRYGNGAAARSLKITVNGAVVNAALSFPGTGSWDVWKTVAISAALNAGSNTVRATAIGSSGPNIDNLTVH